MTLLFLPVIGFVIGLIIISLGGGGGGFYVGVLTSLFNIPPAIAASTSLATIVPTTLVGTIGYAKAGNVNFRLGYIMTTAAVIGAIAGSLFSKHIPENLYNKITGLLLITLGLQMFVEYIRQRKHRLQENNIPNNKYKLFDLAKASVYGMLGGIMSGLVGISGTTPIVAGLIVLRCSALEIIGTSVFVLVGISVTGFLMHLGLGNVDWRLVGLLIVGTTSGAFLAPFILSKFKKETLEKSLPPIIIAMVLVMGIIVICK